MKKVLGIVLALASLGFGGFTSKANATEVANSSVTLAANANPQMAQWERDRYGRRVYNKRYYNRRRVRVVRQ